MLDTFCALTQLAERPVLDTFSRWNRSFSATVSPVNDHVLANYNECCEEILSVYILFWPSNETALLSVGGRVRVSLVGHIPLKALDHTLWH
jgi:hypothetical protein